MKKLLTLFLISFLLTAATKKSDYTKIGFSNGEKFVITADTLAMKKRWNEVLGIKAGFSKMRIVKRTSLGEKQMECYLLIANTSTESSTARWLMREGNDFYIYDGAPNENETLYRNFYITCTGDSDCDPNVMVIDKKIKLGCGTKLECSIVPAGCTAATAIAF